MLRDRDRDREVLRDRDRGVLRVWSSAGDRLQGQHSLPGGTDGHGRGQTLWIIVLSPSHGVGLYFREL